MTLRIDAGGSDRYCDGLTRRSFVQLGVAGMASLGLGDVLRAKAHSAPSPGRRAGTSKKSVILIWLDGGPSHLDLYDLKPEAPSEIRGIWKPIRTNVPGFEISELFPKQAQVADKFSIVRSLYHGTGDHFAGGHRMLTSKEMGVSGANQSGRFPSIGSIIAHQRGANRRGMPAYIAVPIAASIGLVPGYFGGNWLGAQFDPFQTGGDPNGATFQVQNLDLVAGLSLARLEDRRSLMRHLDNVPRAVDSIGKFATLDQFDRDAYEFVSGKEARAAFSIDRENPKTRERYGRHTWGQSTLLARRLVEAGATFVTVHLGGWDHHWNLQSGMENNLPIVDTLLTALFCDLEERGLLATTLVVLCGEFSRTPRMNDGGNGGPPRSMGTPGRDHWGDAMFCLLGGGGIRGGQIVGSTDAKGYRPLAHPLRPQNIHATIYKCLGIDPALKLFDLQGRPTPVLEDPSPINELV
jgi:Protein of unknown function (DUF1501)